MNDINNVDVFIKHLYYLIYTNKNIIQNSIQIIELSRNVFTNLLKEETINTIITKLEKINNSINNSNINSRNKSSELQNNDNFINNVKNWNYYRFDLWRLYII